MSIAFKLACDDSIANLTVKKVSEGVKMGSRFCKLVNFKNNLAQMLSGKRSNVKFDPGN